MSQGFYSDKTVLLIGISFFAPLLFVTSHSTFHSSIDRSIQTSTWSIAAIDPSTGDVGVAGASCVPDIHADALAALVPGKGAAVTQALFIVENRNRVSQLLLSGHSADEIIRQVSDRDSDFSVENRQYGVVTIRDGSVNAGVFTGTNNPEWSGSQLDTEWGVTVQGNTLVSEAVVANAMDAFRADSDFDRNALPDRLMRALEAGSAAGGDTRCNNDQVEQTAATAFILVARGTDEPYATKNIGMTDMGTTEAPWLAISVAVSQFGPNPLIELRTLYDAWREENLARNETSPGSPLTFFVVVIIALGVFTLVGVWIKRRNPLTSE